MAQHHQQLIPGDADERRPFEVGQEWISSNPRRRRGGSVTRYVDRLGRWWTEDGEQITAIADGLRPWTEPPPLWNTTNKTSTHDALDHLGHPVVEMVVGLTLRAFDAARDMTQDEFDRLVSGWLDRLNDSNKVAA